MTPSSPHTPGPSTDAIIGSTRARGRRPQVLAVDDHALNVELLRQDLGEAGFDVIGAYSAQEARARIDERHPDLVLLDVMMPGTTGIDLLRHLRDHDATHDLPVILVTAKSTPQDVAEGLRAGANDYVTKPIELEILLARMETQLRLRDLQAEVRAQNQRIQLDLAAAQRVQASLLPDPATLEEQAAGFGLRFFTCSRPSELLTGDFWDVVPLADSSLGILLADFIGQGVIPAFNTFRLKTFFQASCSGITNPGLAFDRINAHLVRHMPAGHFATACYLRYDPSRRELAIAQAAHCEPLYFSRATASTRTLGGGGRPLGLVPNATWAESTLTVATGDLLLLYTIGLARILGDSRETLGHGYLREILNRHAPSGIQALDAELRQRVESVSEKHRPQDDITYLLIEFTR